MPTFKVYLVDHFDSFTYNLVHLLQMAGCEVSVVHPQEVSTADALRFTHVLLGPGPGHPHDYPDTIELLSALPVNMPVLGVCLGMQQMLSCLNVQPVNLQIPCHGGVEELQIHHATDVFRGIEACRAGRYHSWGFTIDQLPDECKLLASSGDGFVMAFSCQTRNWTGVQFHPESVMTTHGKQMMMNWLQPEHVNPTISRAVPA